MNPEAGAVGKWAGVAMPRYGSAPSGALPCDIRVAAPAKNFEDKNENKNLTTNTYAIILAITRFEA